MPKPLVLLVFISVFILVANVKVNQGLKEVDYQCTTNRVVDVRSKLIVTEVVDSNSYSIHQGTVVTQYRLPNNCAFSTKPRNYLNEKWGNPE